jgi:hypothetical protein
MNAQLFGTLFAIVALGLGARAVGPSVMSMVTIPQDQAVGGQIADIAAAARTHITTNFSALVALTGGVGGTVDIPITATACAPVANCLLIQPFNNLNLFNQTYVFKIVQTSSNRLMALVLSCNGTAIEDLRALRVAKAALPNGVAIIAETPSLIVSPSKTHSVSVSTFAFGACQPSAGHVGALLAADSGQVEGPFLHRYAGATNETNTQHVTIYGDQTNPAAPVDILGFRDVTATRNVTAGANVIAGSDVTAGRDVTATRNVTAGSRLGVGSRSLYDSGGALRTTDKMTADGGSRSDLLVSEGQGGCDNGTQGRDSAGQPFICVNGTFQRIRYGSLNSRLAGNTITGYWDTGGGNLQTSTDSFYLSTAGTLVAESWIAANGSNGQSQVGAHLIIDGNYCGFARHTDPWGQSWARTSASCVMNLSAGWHSIYGITGNMIWGGCVGCTPPIWRYELTYSVFANAI